jgi:hypothetical protein
MSLKQEEIASVIAPHTTSESLVRQRSFYLARYANYINADSIEDLVKDPETAIAFCKDNTTNPGTMRTRILHFTQLARILDAPSKETFNEAGRSLIKAVSEHRENNRQTSVNAERYKPMDEIRAKLREQLTRNLKVLSAARNTRNKIDALRELQQTIILGMYVFIPPKRDDLAEIKLYRLKKEIGTDYTENQCYVPRSTGRVEIILNQYKTARTYGQHRFTVDDDQLNTAIIRFVNGLSEVIEDVPKQLFYWHLTYGSIAPASARAIGNQIHKWAMRAIGTPMTINDFRHVYEGWLQNTEEYKQMTYIQKKQEHLKMLHSLNEGVRYNKPKPTA